MKVTINARAIRAVLNHAAQGDVRFYLNAVILRPARGGGVLAIASDGHRFAVCHDPAGSWGGEDREVIVHRDRYYPKPFRTVKGWKDSTLSEAVKATKDDRICTVEASGDSLAVEVGGVTIAGKACDGKAPSFRAALRETYVPDPSGVNPHYLSDACEAAAIVTRDEKYAGAILHTAGEAGQIMLTATERKPPSQALRLFCVIMALRSLIRDTSKPRPLPDHAAWILDVL
jgi:DNA polymerase III sliding clamp (beta) subunit (PCNA family)